MTKNIFKIIFYILPVSFSPFLGCNCEDKIISTGVPPDNPSVIKLYSSDGGLTWESHILSSVAGDLPDVLYSIASTSQGVFLVSGYRSDGMKVVVGKSTNFGDDFYFREVGNQHEASRSMVLNTALDSAVLIINRSSLHSQDAQQVTGNNGSNWTVVSNIGGLNSVSFYDASNGIAVGDLGMVFKTTNGGNNWVSVTSPTSTDLHDISFYPGGSGLAVGMLGRVIKTTNGGNTWAVISTPNQSTLAGVVFFTPDDAVAVGSNGTIIRSTDAGDTWQEIEFGNDFLNDVGYNALDGTLIVCGSGGTILRSTNNGISWIRQSSGTIRTLYGLYLLGECYIVGD